MKYPIYPIAFSYVGGIFCSFYLKLPAIAVVSVAVLSFLTLVVLYLLQRKKSFNSKLNTFSMVAVVFAFSSLGFLIHHFNNKPVLIDDLQQNELTVKITEVLKSNNYSHRAYAELLSNKQQPNVLVTYTNKAPLPKIGAVYKLVGTVKEVPQPRNLYDFNYKQYLGNKHIFYQIHSNHSPVKIAEEPSVNTLIVNFRNYLVAQFDRLGYPEKTKGFIEALLFGIKTNLNDEIQQQFKDFGILHVLAVSGMHVVLLFSTISYVLINLRLPKNAITVILVVFLLIFSLMAGFSGSVVRASLMCLMTILGALTASRVYTINLLVGSMLIILLVEPNYLFDVGFQLSYLAVFSIVFCYPIIQRFFTFKNWVLNGLGQIVGVSLVAQLGVLPLSIYYFNQIPLLFLVGNIIAVPITSFLLVAWFVQMLLSLISVKILAVFTPLLNWISTFCFDSLSSMSDYFSIKTIDFHFNILQTILALLIVFCGFWFFHKKNISKVFIFLGLIIGFQFATLTKLYQSSNQKELVLLSDTKNMVFLNREGHHIQQIGTATKFTNQSIKNYVLNNSAAVTTVDSVGNAFTLNNKTWLIIDSLSVYPKKQFDYVVLRQNPKVNLDRLLQDVQPEMIVLHNSNYQYLGDEYAAYFKERKIPYYNMRSKGSFVMNYIWGNN